MAPATRRSLLRVLKALVTLALVAVLLDRIRAQTGFEALTRRLAHLDLEYVLLATLAHFGAVLCGVLRWQRLLAARALQVPFTRLLRSFLIGRFVGAFTPSTTGLDGYRALDIGELTGKRTESLSVIGVEKLVGLVGMALVTCALLPLGLGGLLGPSGLVVALGMATIALIGLALLASPARLTRIVPRRFEARAKPWIERIAGGLDPRTLVAAVALGVGSHTCLASTYALSGLALSVPVPFTLVLGVGNAILLAVLLPISLGGIGVREGVAVALLTSQGVSSADAVLVAMLGYVTGQAPALLGGFASLATRPKEGSRTR